MVRRVMMMALIAMIAIVMTSCSIVYTASYERKGVECLELGLFGTPNPEQGPPYGLIPLFRNIEHHDEEWDDDDDEWDDDDDEPDERAADEPLYKLTPVD